MLYTILLDINAFVFLWQIRAILPLFVPQHVMVARMDEAGNIVEALHDQGGRTLYSISEAFEYGNELIIGSFEAPFIGKLKLNHRSLEKI